MTNSMNVASIISQPQQPQRKQQNNVYRMPSSNNQYVRQQPVMSQDDMLTRYIEKQEKEQKKKNFWNKVGLFAGIGASLAIIASIFFMRNGGAAKNEMKSITKTTVKWQDFKGGARRTAKLSDGTTNQNLKKQFEQIKDNNILSEEAKSWAGVKEQADVYYLYGYGGTGKTYATEQIAEDLNAMYACVKYPDLGSPFKDAASMKIASFFDDIVAVANKDPNRPVVVCIDEADALIQKVSEKAMSDEPKKIRSAVLTGIDNITKNAKNVKLFLTSNYHPESGIVDDVVLRRVNKKLKVDLPDYKQADALCKMYLADVKAISPDFYNSSEYVDFVNKIITKGNDLGYSGSEISNIMSEAKKEFAATLKGVPDNELVAKRPFRVKFLEDAMAVVGRPAARSNTSMLTAAERGTIIK